MPTVAELVSAGRAAQAKIETDREIAHQQDKRERFEVARTQLRQLLEKFFGWQIDPEQVVWQPYNGSASIVIDGIMFAKEAPRDMQLGYVPYDLTHVDVFVVCPNGHIIYREHGGATCWVDNAETLTKAVDTIERESQTCSACIASGRLKTLDQRWREAVSIAPRGDLLVALEILRKRASERDVTEALDRLDGFRARLETEANAAFYVDNIAWQDR